MNSSSPEYVPLTSRRVNNERPTSFTRLSLGTHEGRTRESRGSHKISPRASLGTREKMQCLEPQKTTILLLTIPEAMRRYGFNDPSGFRKFRRQLAIPSPRKTPFQVMHVLRMDECWIAENLPSLKLNRAQFKSMVMASGKSLKATVKHFYDIDIAELIKQESAEFQNHPIVQTYLQRLAIERNPNEYR